MTFLSSDDVQRALTKDTEVKIPDAYQDDFEEWFDYADTQKGVTGVCYELLRSEEWFQHGILRRLGGDTELFSQRLSHFILAQLMGRAGVASDDVRLQTWANGVFRVVCLGCFIPLDGPAFALIKAILKTPDESDVNWSPIIVNRGRAKFAGVCEFEFDRGGAGLIIKGAEASPFIKNTLLKPAFQRIFAAIHQVHSIRNRISEAGAYRAIDEVDLSPAIETIAAISKSNARAFDTAEDIYKFDFKEIVFDFCGVPSRWQYQRRCAIDGKTVH